MWCSFLELTLPPLYVSCRAFKQAERVHASRMIIFGVDEWQRGTVKVKDLLARSEVEMPFDQLV